MRKWPVPAPSGWPMRRARVKWLGPTQNIRTGGGGFACIAQTLADEGVHLGRRQWMAEVVTLGFIATLLAQEGELTFGFHPLRDGAHSQRLCHADDGTHDGAVVGVVFQVSYE